MKKQFESLVRWWLYTGAVLVLLMVIIGGITRLTHSGLSMVDWKPISGVIPPLSAEDWEAEFENYKQYPEFQKLNYNFELADFQRIFWWEFIHRLLGRVIGIVFIVPYAWFLLRKAFDRKWHLRLLLLFFLGGLQGLIGWFMVKSGLVDNPQVSHYRLAIHFMAAMTVYCYIVWLLLLMKRTVPKRGPRILRTWSFVLLGLTLIQLIYGTFVAGLKAGLMFNTWPLMDGAIASPLVGELIRQNGFLSFIEDPATVQFIHRLLPFLILGSIIALWRLSATYPGVRKTVALVVLFWTIQFLLGVFTLIYQVPLVLGVLHQLGGVLFLTVVVHLIFRQLFRFEENYGQGG